MEGNPGSLILCSVSIFGVGEGQRDTHCLLLVLTLDPGKTGCFSAAHFTAALLTHLVLPVHLGILSKCIGISRVMRMTLIHGPLFEEVKSPTCPPRIKNLWGPGMLLTLSLCLFSRSFSSYPRCTNPPPKWPLSHLLHLKVPLPWPVLLRMFATGVYILDLQGTEGG